MHAAPLPMPWPPVDVALAADLEAADPLHLLDEAASAAAAGVDWLHVELMDGRLHPRLGLSPQIPAALVTRQPLPVCAHILCKHPLHFAMPLADRGVSLIIVAAEATSQPRTLADKIRQAGGARVGLSLQPSTPLALIESAIDVLDLVLLLATEPGELGSPFVPATLEKLTALCQLAQRRAPKCVLGVKGDLTPPRAKSLAEAGAQLFVSGRFIFQSAQRRTQVDQLRAQAQQGQKAWLPPSAPSRG